MGSIEIRSSFLTDKVNMLNVDYGLPSMLLFCPQYSVDLCFLPASFPTAQCKLVYTQGYKLVGISLRENGNIKSDINKTQMIK